MRVFVDTCVSAAALQNQQIGLKYKNSRPYQSLELGKELAVLFSPETGFLVVVFRMLS